MNEGMKESLKFLPKMHVLLVEVIRPLTLNETNLSSSWTGKI